MSHKNCLKCLAQLVAVAREPVALYLYHQSATGPAANPLASSTHSVDGKVAVVAGAVVVVVVAVVAGAVVVIATLHCPVLINKLRAVIYI